MIDWQHPDYFKVSQRIRKISPDVGLQMDSCAVFARGPVGAWVGFTTKAQTDEIHFKENLCKSKKGKQRNKNITELARDAPGSLCNAALEYLRTDWSSKIKHTLPESLDAIGSHDKLREKMVKLKYIVQFWKIGEKTKMDDSWTDLALLSFSEDELRLGISHRADWNGLTEFLQIAISICKGHAKHDKHELWEEHDVLDIAGTFAKSTNLAKKFSALDSKVTYNEAPAELRLTLLKAINCEVQQKGSWWEDDQHFAYICFQWPEGLNLAYYHILFNVETRDVLKKYQNHYRRKIRNGMKGYKGQSIYCGGKYTEERLLLEAASREIPKLRSEVSAALQNSRVKQVCSEILNFWRPDMGLLLFRVMRKDLHG